MSIPFRELIDKHCGGIRGGWDNLLAVIPGGLLGALRAGRRDHRHADGFRQPAALKSGLGTAAVIVMDKSTDIIKAIARLAISTSTRAAASARRAAKGTGWMWRVLDAWSKAMRTSARSTCCSM
jgi:NADH-quinone oxidoreductase subunit F